MASPANSGSLPSNNSFKVSKNRLLPKRRGRGQEVVRTLVEQPADVGGLIDVVAVLFPNFAEGLNADGQSAFAHGCLLSFWVGTWLSACRHFRTDPSVQSCAMALHGWLGHRIILGMVVFSVLNIDEITKQRQA